VGQEATATFAFVDLSGFSALTEAHGDSEALALLNRFEAIVRVSLGPGDQLVKTIGDAAMLRFANPVRAVERLARLFAACLAEAAFPVPRAGLHQGPALERAGDWFGATVNLAARIASLASGGQVLSSAEVAKAARSAGHTVVDLGAFQLRNITQLVQIFELQLCPGLTDTTVDPVCRMQVVRATAAGRLRHRQRDFWFCSLRCASTFAADPDHYLSS
jgi:class 3 adenylate cyclase